MKLSDIVQLKSMGYSEEIKPKHLKRMKQTPSMLKDFEWKLFAGQPPHQNDSTKTKMELHQLAKLPMDKPFVEEMDDVVSVFSEYCNINGLDFPKQLIKTLLDDSSIIILVNVPMKDNELDSMKTPSYPSGHSTQGMLVAMVLSDMYSDHEFNLMSLSKDISYSRNVARAHYPSDSRFGETLGEEMFKYLKKMGRL